MLRSVQCYRFNQQLTNFSKRFASKDHHHSEPEEKIDRQPDLYRPGSDSYAYENPWPKLNKGRLDWIFQDGWRRPLATDQGAKMRREWIWFGQVPYDEHKDWLRFHRVAIVFYTFMCVGSTITIVYLIPDWPSCREWALREAHFEIHRREKAGLPHISKDLLDPARVMASLPSEEELRDFEIII